MKKIKNLLKTNKIIYTIYSNTFNFLLKIISIFIKTDNKLILFNSFGGKKYDDSPRVIFEYIISNPKYAKYKLCWVFDNPSKFKVTNCKIVKNNTLSFFITALRAKYWITNSGIERGLKFKKKNTIYVNTWHGTAIKHIGIDENNLSVKIKTSKPDFLYAQSKYDVEIFSHVFELPKEKIILCGLPRNDELSELKETEIVKIRKKLSIPNGKKVIMYAPTFREYKRDKDGCFLAPPINLNKWEKELSNDYVLLFRAHYEINRVLGIKENNFVKDMSNYSNLNEILKITDILISDYSSIMIDYSILERPIFNYVYDYNEYEEQRGMYFDLRKKIPGNCIENEEELIKAIKNIDFEKESQKSKKFKEEFVQEYGKSRMYIDNIILEEEK